MKNNKLILFFLTSGMLLFIGCPKPAEEMMVTTGEPDKVLATTADVSGEIIDLGEGATQYGHCYSTSQNPTTALPTKTEKGIPVIGKFTSNLTNLNPSTKYYVKAYISRGNNVAYGEQKEFETASDTKPQLTTKSIISKTKTSAVTGGDITNEGGTPVTSKGVCWGLATDPIVDGNPNKTNDGSGTAGFTSNMTGLMAGTYYYVKAYATNNGGIGYGNQVEFWTESDASTPPTITTAAITSVTATTAVCGGNVTNEGGSTVLHKGVCWSLSDNPTTTNYHTDDGTGGGVFISNIPGSNPALTPGTLYHVRAYASNNTGVPSYAANEYTFITCRAPLATTNAATFTTTTTATLNGVVNANSVNDSITKVSFEYGTNTSYGSIVVATPGSLTGSSNTAVSAEVTGLTPNTVYHYKVDAVNCGGLIYGNDQTFATHCIAPTATTNAASNFGNTTATLNGTVNANGFSTAVTFEYGQTTGYGSTITATPGTATGSSSTPVSAGVSGLLPNTLYHYRLKTENCEGITFGGDMTFTTSLSIGASYQGGIVAYIFQSGDPGYVAGQIHGLIAATTGQTTAGAQWYNGSYTLIMTGTAIGTGSANTTAIITNQGNTGTYAAKLCRDYSGGGYNDWYLPSKDELNKLYVNKAAIGVFQSLYYWSSSQVENYTAWSQSFTDGTQAVLTTPTYQRVHAVRTF